MRRSFGRQVFGALSRDRDLPVRALVWKIARNLSAFASGRFALRGCDKVGSRPRRFGRLDVVNDGRIVIGADFAAGGAFAPVRLATSEAGAIEIGERVVINYGTCISSRSLVRIGSGAKIGPHCILSDADVPLPMGLPEDGLPRSIVIGDDVWLGARVVVQPGVRIGAGAVIGAGSFVDEDIPPRAIVAGIPARVLRVAEPQAPAPASHVREREPSTKAPSAAVA